MEREISDVLTPIGVEESTCKIVARDLRNAEDELLLGGNSVTSSNRLPDEESISLRWSKEVGLTAFMLKFGEGLGRFPCIQSLG